MERRKVVVFEKEIDDIDTFYKEQLHKKYKGKYIGYDIEKYRYDLVIQYYRYETNKEIIKRLKKYISNFKKEIENIEQLKITSPDICMLYNCPMYRQIKGAEEIMNAYNRAIESRLRNIEEYKIELYNINK